MKLRLTPNVTPRPPLPTVESVAPGDVFTTIPTGVVYMRLSDSKPSYPAGTRRPPPKHWPTPYGCDAPLVACATLGTGRVVFLDPQKEVYPVEAVVSISSRWGTPNVKGKEDSE